MSRRDQLGSDINLICRVRMTSRYYLQSIWTQLADEDELIGFLGFFASLQVQTANLLSGEIGVEHTASESG